MDRRIAAGVGAVREERHRVLWDNLPIWYRIGPLSQWLAARGVNVVASTYAHAWGELAPLMDPADPFDSMARVYLHPILNRSAGQKLEAMRRMVRDFSADGVILHSDRSCKPYSLGQIDQRDGLVNQVGVPALLLDADHNDPRAFAEEQAAARLEAFVETMERMSAAAAFGIDAGSTTCKVVAVDAAGEFLAFRLEATRPRLEEQAAALVAALAADLGLAAPPPLVATGYGRGLVRGRRPPGHRDHLPRPGRLPGAGPRRHPGGHRRPGRQGHPHRAETGAPWTSP